MGTKILELINMQEISLDDLKNKTLVVDAYNMLYMFITTIRQSDGSLLKDSKGNVTSHLSGLFSRVTRLLLKNIKLIFVFDGKPPELKMKERERRRKLKEEALTKYEAAKDAEDISEMKKYAGRTARLTPDLVEESKLFLAYMGIPVIEAPSEGEAQASYMVQQGDAYAIVSQDADSLLFKAPVVVKDLNISRTRRKTGTNVYQTINPKLIKLNEALTTLGLDQDQLIVLGMLVGTDFNIGGIKGIGPQKAMKLLKEHDKNFDALFEAAKWDEHFDFSWKEVFDTIKKMPIDKEYKISFGKIDKAKVIELMVEKHDFNKERIENTLEKIEKSQKNLQKSLFEF